MRFNDIILLQMHPSRLGEHLSSLKGKAVEDCNTNEEGRVGRIVLVDLEVLLG